MKYTNTRRAVAGLALLASLAAACGDDDDTTTAAAPSTTQATVAVETTAAGTTDEEMGDVLEVASVEGDLTTFLGALESAGIMDGLHGEGPFTVFIPTDAAFQDYLASSGMTQDELAASGEMLINILDNHIVDALEDSEMVMGMAGQSFTSAAGNPLDVTVDGDNVMVNDAMVLRYDLHASNGVVHVIDHVLAPPA